MTQKEQYINLKRKEDICKDINDDKCQQVMQVLSHIINIQIH